MKIPENKPLYFYTKIIGEKLYSIHYGSKENFHKIPTGITRNGFMLENLTIAFKAYIL